MHHFHEVEMLHTMKAACAKVAIKLCLELFHRFPNVEIMATLGMVYPQYWMCEKTTMNNFQTGSKPHFVLIKNSRGKL